MAERMAAQQLDDNSEEEEGIGGAKKRRRRPPTDVEVVQSPDLREAAVETKLDGPENDATGANAVSDTHEFTLDYTDPRGHHWGGNFKCHVLTIRDRATIGLTRARLCGGMRPDQIDDSTLQIAEMQAHLAVAMDTAPDWAETLSDIRDVGVLASIYGEVASHEARFWGADLPAKSGGDV